MLNFSRTHILRSLLLLTLPLAGCMTEGDPGAVRTDPYEAAVTPDILMENFTKAYAGRDLDGYADLLDEDFVFALQKCTVEKLGLSSDHYTREDELIVARNMFCGKPVQNSRGQWQPAVTDIEFLEWAQVEPWRKVERQGVADCREGVFQLRVRISRDSAVNLESEGQAIFYAAGVETEDGLRYRLLGWVDLTRGCR